MIVKSATQKSNVKIVVADDEAFMREVVVNALGAGGYRDIRSATRLDSLQGVIDSIYPDLMILNGDMAEGDTVDFVQKMRMHCIGRNPFIPIILTAWHADRVFVRKVLDSGADVLVTKPFAAGQLFARIDFLTDARPPFVATASYIGPDRRKSPRGDAVPHFDVPNTLKERIDGRGFDPEDLDSRISKLFPAMMRQRLLCQEQEIGSQYAAIAKATRERRPVAEISSVISAIVASATRYAGEMKSAHGNGNAGHAEALVKKLKAIAAAGKGFSGEDCEATERMLDALGIIVPRIPGSGPGSADAGVSVHTAPVN
jgi:CheY-like chemotaxis protein